MAKIPIMTEIRHNPIWPDSSKMIRKIARLGAISMLVQFQKILHFSKLLSRVQLWAN